MNKEIIVNAGSHETRIAVIENNQVTELFIERKFNKGIAGNIYKGKVTKVLPGMQSAFVDIGLDRDAFLYVGDISENLLNIEEFFEDFNEEEEEKPTKEQTEESTYPPVNANLQIEDLLKEGQELLVQISKEPIGSKGPRITAHISLPGRYIVYMPSINHIGISRKIEDTLEKERLKELVESLKTGPGGYIVRTAGEGMGVTAFKQDIQFLNTLWKEVIYEAEKATAPALIYEELGLIQKVIRDVFNDDTSIMLIDSDEVYQQALNFIDKINLSWASKIKLYTKKQPIFYEYDIESQIESALRSKVWLKSGGYIVINQTEALVAIDVNTGRFIGKKSLEDTVFKTNIEAIREIVRQIRLRNLGGIIVVDFIDMEDPEHKTELLRNLEEELKKDRSRSNIISISEIGLIAITRKRVKQSLERFLTKTCPTCKGSGRVKSVPTIVLQLQREIVSKLTINFDRDITVRVHPSIAEYLIEDQFSVLSSIKNLYNIRVSIKEDPNMQPEEYNIVFN
jgi:ribonuclease G